MIIHVLKMTEKELVAGLDYFKDSYDTFGFEETDFGINQVKEKLKGLLERNGRYRTRTG